jgi:hypothetical protein
MRRFKILLGLAVALYVAACSYFWFTQDQKIFKPMRELASDPGRLDREFDRIKIDIGNGDLKKRSTPFGSQLRTPDHPLYSTCMDKMQTSERTCSIRVTYTNQDIAYLLLTTADLGRVLEDSSQAK